MVFKFVLGILVIFIISSACSKAEDDAQIGVTAGILGSWQGIFRYSGQESQIADVSLRLDPTVGFELRRLGTEGVANGTYDDFPQLRSLTLRVEESTDQELALAGIVRDYDYELFGDELLLTGVDHILRLKRPLNGLDSKQDQIWTCIQGDQSWQMTLTGQTFVLYLPNPGGTSLFLTGDILLDEIDPSDTQQAGTFYVRDGQPIIPFTKLIADLRLSEGQVLDIQLTPIDDENNLYEILDCTVLNEEEDS
ncbi:MAG: hypothetical protein HRU19_12015 [Pseudobacteriovorax sp.]|nr:hypothetical protein [Pseudobacteriovorax sp.]